MKIAYITQSYPPMISGASLVVKSLADGMAARGHSALVIAASDKGPSYTTKKGCIKTVRLTSLPNPKRAQQNFVLWSRNAIEDELNQFSPDVLHIHDILSMGVFGLLTAQRSATPIVSTIHQLPWFISAYLPQLPGLHETIEYSLWEYSRWLNKQCQVVVVPTRTIAETIQRQAGFRPKAISNGIDLCKFRNDELLKSERHLMYDKYGLTPNCPIILHVGRLDADKRVDIVIRAAAKVLKKTNSQLLVIGDGELRESLINLTRQLKIHQRSHFPGFVSNSGDLPDIYRLASVFTTASEIETQGLVLLEALASSLPVVAVNATCIPELVIHKKNGYLVHPGDVEGMAKALTILIREPSLAKQMGRVGRTIVNEHSIDTSLYKQEKIYKELVVQSCERIKPTSLWNKSQSLFNHLSGFELRRRDR